MSIGDFKVPGLKPANSGPRYLMLGGIEFDPLVHLQLEFPNSLKDLKFETIDYPFISKTTCGKNLAYTRPFRVLSDAGIQAARESLEENMSKLGKSTTRATKFVRGLGYTSKFHRGLCYSPELLSLLSDFAGEEVCPHSMTMNISHTNIGDIHTGKPVDKWHVDSVDYVLIIILSDLTDMVGGELRVLQQPNDSAGTLFQKLLKTGIPRYAPIETVHYVAAGYGIFMQGSKIFHTVNEVLSAREPRLSLVNSFMPLRPFAEELTHYSTFADGGDGREIAHVEYARHKAWRVAGQMQFVLEKVVFPDCAEGVEASERMVSGILFNAAQELLHAAHLIRGEENDNAGWVEEQKAEDLSHPVSPPSPPSPPTPPSPTVATVAALTEAFAARAGVTTDKEEPMW